MMNTWTKLRAIGKIKKRPMDQSNKEESLQRQVTLTKSHKQMRKTQAHMTRVWKP